MDILEIQSFLKGYFYRDYYKNTLNEYDNNCSLSFCLRNGGECKFLINRGICPNMGHTAFAFYDVDSSKFDTTETLVSSIIWNYLIEMGLVQEYNEVRISFDQLCELIKNFGGFDYSKML